MSVLLSNEILRVKLADWVLSAKIGEVLTLKEEDEAAAKKQLEALVEKGVLERDGQRRGLKYRYNKNYEPSDSEESSNDEEVVVSKSKHTVEAPTINLDLFERQKNADLEKATNGAFKTLPGLVSSLIKSNPSSDSGILSYTISLKKTCEGIYVVRLYSGLTPVHEVSLTRDKFIKYITESGVTIHE